MVPEANFLLASPGPWAFSVHNKSGVTLWDLQVTLDRRLDYVPSLDNRHPDYPMPDVFGAGTNPDPCHTGERTFGIDYTLRDYLVSVRPERLDAFHEGRPRGVHYNGMMDKGYYGLCWDQYVGQEGIRAHNGACYCFSQVGYHG